MCLLAPDYVLKLSNVHVILGPQPAADVEQPTSLAQNSVTVINVMTTEIPRQPDGLQEARKIRSQMNQRMTIDCLLALVPNTLTGILKCNLALIT